MTIFNLLKWAGIPERMEAVNMFSRYIPQAELARFEGLRQKQGLIPDFLIALKAGGQPHSVLHELNVTSISQSR